MGDPSCQLGLQDLVSAGAYPQSGQHVVCGPEDSLFPTLLRLQNLGVVARDAGDRWCLSEKGVSSLEVGVVPPVLV